MARYIGVRHRVKQTAKGEARPTQISIVDGDEVSIHDLATEMDELDFVHCRLPIEHRDVVPGEDISMHKTHHLKLKKLKVGEEPSDPAFLVLTADGERCEVKGVPSKYEGFRPGDVFAMVLGGSGDKLAFSLSRRAEELGEGARVIRVPSFVFKQERGAAEKDDDAGILAGLGETKPEFFQTITPRDRMIIAVREAFTARMEAMQARIGCEQRLKQRFIGSIFCSAEGKYPEGTIEQLFAAKKANDVIFKALSLEEGRADRELAKIVGALDIYQELFLPLEGFGPAIVARLVSAIIDIRRFSTPGKLKAFCGVSCTDEGKFMRRRTGEVASWHPDARQALYLAGDQFNRRPNSVWGKVLLAYKVILRKAHPTELYGLREVIALFQDIWRFFAKFDIRVPIGKPEGEEFTIVDLSQYFAERKLELEATLVTTDAELGAVATAADNEVLAMLREEWNWIDRTKTEGELIARYRESSLEKQALIAEHRNKLTELSTRVMDLETALATPDEPVATTETSEKKKGKGKSRKVKVIKKARVTAYGKGHILKMALWRTLTKFTEWLWHSWWKIEERHGATRNVTYKEPFIPGKSTPPPVTPTEAIEQLDA